MKLKRKMILKLLYTIYPLNKILKEREVESRYYKLYNVILLWTVLIMYNLLSLL